MFYLRNDEIPFFNPETPIKENELGNRRQHIRAKREKEQGLGDDVGETFFSLSPEEQNVFYFMREAEQYMYYIRGADAEQRKVLFVDYLKRSEVRNDVPVEAVLLTLEYCGYHILGAKYAMTKDDKPYPGFVYYHDENTKRVAPIMDRTQDMMNAKSWTEARHYFGLVQKEATQCAPALGDVEALRIVAKSIDYYAAVTNRLEMA